MKRLPVCIAGLTCAGATLATGGFIGGVEDGGKCGPFVCGRGRSAGPLGDGFAWFPWISLFTGGFAVGVGAEAAFGFDEGSKF